MSGHRVERVAEAVREVIADILLREIKDPRIGMVTITAVELSKDLRRGKVYFTCLGDEAARERSLAGLRSAAGFVRKEVTRRLGLRSAPDFSFWFDSSIEYAARMEGLLRQSPPGGT